MKLRGKLFHIDKNIKWKFLLLLPWCDQSRIPPPSRIKNSVFNKIIGYYYKSSSVKIDKKFPNCVKITLKYNL